MELNELQRGYKRKKVMSLVEIATLKCIQNVAKLQETGNTPFHLIKPVLKRMSARQLKQLEQRNPQLVPDTDTLWTLLIEKEFPDRPLDIKGISLSSNESMPYRALYFKYEKERESFRNDSTARLRNMTEKLKKQKSANSIISVPQLLKDPTVKRRTYNSSGYSRQTQGANRNSILSKARRELKSRSLMFPENKSRTKTYDPFAVFKLNRPNNNIVRSLNNPLRSQTIRTPRYNTRTSTPMESSFLNKKSPIIASNPKRPSAFTAQSTAITSNSNITANTTNTTNTRISTSTSISVKKKEESPSMVSPPAEKSIKVTAVQPRPAVIKRKREPSIFLTTKRPRMVKPPPKRENAPLKEQPEPTKRLIPVKSSIFS